MPAYFGAHWHLKFDLKPEIKLKDFKDLKINKYEIELGKKAEENQFKIFIDSQKNFKKIESSRQVKNSDKVIVNFESSQEDLPEYLKSQKNFPIDLGFDDGILPGLNKELIERKVKAGDKIVLKINLSKILKDDKFKKTTFNFEIMSIEEKIKFELTKEFLDKNGFKKEKDLKNFLVSNIKTQYEQGIKQIEKKELMDLLDNSYKFDLPDGVLEDDFNQIWHRLEHAKKEGNLDEDDKLLKDEDLKKRYKKISERRVKLGLLMQHIASEEKIIISEEEINKGILEYSSQYPGQEKQIMEYFEKNPSSLDTIRAPLIEQKVIESIISKSKTNVIKLMVVLHHVDNAEDILSSANGVIKPGGSLSLWVYGPRQGMTLMINNALRGMTTSMSHEELLQFARMIARGLRVFSHTPYRFFRHVPVIHSIVSHLPVHDNHKWPFDIVVADIYDRLRIPVCRWFTKEELERWYGNSGYADINVQRIVRNNETFRSFGVKR